MWRILKGFKDLLLDYQRKRAKLLMNSEEQKTNLERQWDCSLSKRRFIKVSLQKQEKLVHWQMQGRVSWEKSFCFQDLRKTWWWPQLGEGRWVLLVLISQQLPWKWFLSKDLWQSLRSQEQTSNQKDLWMK